MALTAFAIDAMLPALPDIAQQLSPANPNHAQLIVTSFVLGMGLGTFVAGPLSDACGRKPVIIAGFGLFNVGSALASLAQSLDLLLAARVLQGLGVAAPRIVPVALIRDLYSGRQMASIMSFSTMIFMLMPAAAPAFGTVIINGYGWRGLFASFIVFAVISALWLALRRLVTATFLAQLAVTLIVLALLKTNALSDDLGFAAYVLWAVSVFSIGNIVFGKLNAIALQRLGHIAGLASSLVITTATVLAVGVAAPLGLLFDGTPVPLLVSVAVLLTIAVALMQAMPREA